MTTILLVEDDVMNREMIARYLNGKGYHVISAGDGANAVLLAKKEHPHLILMDMGLPIINGWQATHRIKTSSDTRDIPIVALTAFAMAEDRQRCLSVGCDAFETKPVNFERLLGTMRDLLSHESGVQAV
ncbi:MAG TPA: response regulator [Roseiflexaceae bacterium]|jgi:CheY-like chemotaxis protein|nr:response regulator [Roseiflexaceae bacterium]